jgi:RimJ/RimL family protein N-acetyltransferase
MRDRRIFTPLTVLLKKSTPRSRSIEADTRAENTASVRVLVQNRFVQLGHSKRSIIDPAGSGINGENGTG